MPGMVWTSLLNSPQPTAAGTALANSAALTDISAAPQFTLPANFLQNGSAVRFYASGVFSNTATPTLLLGVYYGGIAGVALATSGPVTTTTGATNWQWRLELDTVIRTTGTSGTAWSQGLLWLGTSATAMAAIPLPAAAPALVSVDTTTT